jgi:hypothetical protein
MLPSLSSVSETFSFSPCSSLAYKCHLCPRSFECQKSLDKHLLAHKMNRCVEPKVIANADGTLTMALSEDSGDTVKRKPEPPADRLDELVPI